MKYWFLPSLSTGLLLVMTFLIAGQGAQAKLPDGFATQSKDEKKKFLRDQNTSLVGDIETNFKDGTPYTPAFQVKVSDYLEALSLTDPTDPDHAGLSILKVKKDGKDHDLKLGELKGAGPGEKFHDLLEKLDLLVANPDLNEDAVPAESDTSVKRKGKKRGSGEDLVDDEKDKSSKNGGEDEQDEDEHETPGGKKHRKEDHVDDPDLDSEKGNKDSSACEQEKLKLLQKVFQDYIKKRSDLTFLKIARAFMHVKSNMNKKETDSKKKMEEAESEEEKASNMGKVNAQLFDVNKGIKDILADLAPGSSEKNKDLEDLFEFLVNQDRDTSSTVREKIMAFMGSGPSEDNGRLENLRSGLNVILKKAKTSDQKESPDYEFNRSDMFILKNYLAKLPEDTEDTKNRPFAFGEKRDDGLYIQLLKRLKENGDKFDSGKTKGLINGLESVWKDVTIGGEKVPLPQEDDQLSSLLAMLKEQWTKAITDELSKPGDNQLKKACEGLGGPDDQCQNLDDVLNTFLGTDNPKSLHEFVNKATSVLLNPDKSSNRKIELPNLSAGIVEEKKGATATAPPPPQMPFFPMNQGGSPFIPVGPARYPNLLPMPFSFGPMGVPSMGGPFLIP